MIVDTEKRNSVDRNNKVVAGSTIQKEEMLEVEINSVTDNPIVFSKDHTISGGNFHGQPMALPIDYACLAAAEVGNISDRRIYLSLEGDTPGLSRTPLDKMGWRCSATATLYFDDARVPASHLIGPENAGFMAIMHNFNSERLGLAAQAWGLRFASDW